ncbi:MAG: hypothetical protein M3Y72_06570 [Acidobacteriota bacterium]|nr:hypothetical protein [Acidobacteriota bacterium]
MLRKLFTIVVAISVTTASAQYSGSPGYPPLSSGNGGYNQSNPDPSQFGQNERQQPDPADRQHGVARLSIVQGDVNVRRGDNGELTAAVVNAPLFSQDNLQIGGGSRAEVELDYANFLRLAPGTNLIFADVEYRQARVQLGLGTAILRVLRNSESQVEIDTPSVGFHPLSQGEFRISVLDDGTTQITARTGQAEIFGPRGSQRIPNEQTVMVRGDANDPEFQNTYEIGRDGFDDWSEHRDGDLLRSQSYRYVSQDIYGADDLDAYGNWVPSQYGQVWAPQQQAAGWSPYSTGEWAWQNYYGWTWVDSAPWGWAPYHYGRWFMNGGYGWCWWPGAVRASYFWNPAVVGFFGWGGLGVGLALGGLGWVALAPFEIFHSWWGRGWGGRGWGGQRWAGYGYGGRGDIARMYRNAAYRGGAMTAGYNGFGGPHQRFSPATRGQLTNASSFRGGVPIGPTRGSYQFSSRQAFSNPRFASASNRQFFQGSRLSNRGTVATSQFAGSTIRGPSGHSVAPNRQNNFAGRSSSGGWQRFGDPGAGSGLQRGFASSSEQSGWHSFGQPQSFGSRSSGWSGAQSYSSPRYSAPAPSQHYSAPSQHYNAPSQRYNAPSQRYNAPTPHYNTPTQHYSAPSQHYSAPHSSGGSVHGGGSSGGGHSGGGHGGGGHHR